MAFDGSACCVEMTIVWNFKGSTDPSAFCKYSMVTCVLPSGRSHHNRPLLRTSVNFFAQLGRHRVSEGHAIFGFIRGIAEHDALVTGTDVQVLFPDVDAACNVRALLVDAH